MQVTCPNCDRKNLIDTAFLSGAPFQIFCARCGSPFRISLVCEKALTLQCAAPRDELDDVLALPIEATRDSSSLSTRGLTASEPTCVVLDLDDAGEALRRAQASAFTAEDKYRLGARLLNLSPLRLLLAGCAFVVLVGFCDLLLASPASTTNDATLASLQNQATNRATITRRVEPSNNNDDDSLAEESDAQAQTPVESADAKPAAVSDERAPQADSHVASDPALVADQVADAQPASNAVEVSLASARQEIESGASANDQSATKLTIQLASYRTEEEAQKLAQKLQEAGFEARVVTEQNSKRPWYCVQTKNFDTREDAEQYLAGLRAKSFGASYTVREIN
jgi:cell division protein FtsN